MVDPRVSGAGGLSAVHGATDGVAFPAAVIGWLELVTCRKVQLLPLLHLPCAKNLHGVLGTLEFVELEELLGVVVITCCTFPNFLYSSFVSNNFAFNRHEKHT